MRALPVVQVLPQFVPFSGGYDTVTPPLSLGPNFAREAQNFEQDISGGYARIVGYERYSGMAKPSDATYAILPMSTLGVYATDGSVTVTGATSAATGVVVGSATLAGSSYLVITKTTGTFVAENLTAGGGVTSGPAVINGASTVKLHAQYTAAAANVYRALIGLVPGSGKILGVWVYNDVVYAFRNNAGGTAVAMYKASLTGWTLVPLGRELKFSASTATINDGDTVVGGTSGATGVVTRAALQSASWTAGAGSLVFATVTSAFINGEAIKVGGLSKATTVGADSAITFAVPNGRFEFVNANFGGAANTVRMYGCDGKNRAFEFDGTIFVPITTGMVSDAPTHIAAHQNHLFLSFGGSVQFSSSGLPYGWSVIVGAGEIAMGDTVTGFMSQPGSSSGSALSIFTSRNIATLYGSGVSDFSLIPFNQDAGAIAYTVQRIGNTVMLDARGLTNLQTTQAYGNFAWATLSRRVQTWLTSRRPLVTASCVVRDKTQYRLFFSDGSGLYVTLDNGQSTSGGGGFGGWQPPSAPGQVLGMMPVLYPIPVRCVCSAQLSDGSEAMYFGSDDGYVRQMDRGTSFDGVAIEFFLSMAYNASGNPREEKRYRRCTFEITGGGYFEFDFSYVLGYASANYEQPGSAVVANALSATNWDSMVWDSFIWDGVNLLPAETDLDGTAENISLIIRGSSDYMPSARISGATIQYSRRRNLR